MLAAAEAWGALASGMYSAASSYRSVVSALVSGPWLGLSSAAMAAAANSYVAWLSSTAAQAEHTANQARTAAAAYEAAFAATVPPEVVAANRSRLTLLVATNLLGQNTSAIATTEAQYADMWSQDAAAMTGYAGSSASATTLTPFIPPQQNTDPSGSAGQAVATTSTAAGTQAFSLVPNVLQSLITSVLAALPSSSTLDTIANLISIFLDLPADVAELSVDVPLSILGIVSLPLDIGGLGTGVHTDDIVSGWDGEKPWPEEGPAPVKELPAPLTNRPPGTLPEPRFTVGLGEANTVGMLSVPATWTIATPAVRPIAVTLPALPATGSGQAGEGGLGGTLSQMALGGMAGRAMAGTLGSRGGRGGDAAKGARVATRAAAAPTDESAAGDGAAEASQSQSRPVVTGVAAELREFAKLRDEGILNDEEYTEQKNRLLGR